MVDACDRNRLPESKAELDSLLTDESLANCPVLVLGNKIDRPGAASEDELRAFFCLYGQTTGKVIGYSFYYSQMLLTITKIFIARYIYIFLILLANFRNHDNKHSVDFLNLSFLLF